MDEMQINLNMMNGLAAAGKCGLGWLCVALNRADKNRDALLSNSEFLQAMDAVHWLSSREKQALFLAASRGTGRNEIRWRDFVSRLAGEMSPKRRTFLTQLFQNLFGHRDPSVEEVKACLRGADCQSIVETIRALGLFQPQLSLDGFLEYYRLEACLQSDEQFESQVTALWRATASSSLAQYKGDKNTLATQTPRHDAFLSARQAIQNIGGLIPFIILVRKWRSADSQKCGFLDQDQLCRCIRELDHETDDLEDAVRDLIAQFPNESYEKLIDYIRGELPIARRTLVDAAFDAISSGGGPIEPKVLVQSFDASNHPHVLRGIKSKDQVFQEFIDTFDVGPQGFVTRDDFVEYYAALSAFIEDDHDFEQLVQGVWRLKNQSTQSKTLLVSTNNPQRELPLSKNHTLRAARNKPFPVGVGAIIQRIRSTITGPHGYHQLKQALRKRSQLGLGELIAAFKEVGIENCSRRDAEAIFRSLVDNGESLDPDIAYEAILPPPSQHRAIMIRSAFDCLDASAGGKGFLLPNQIVDRYDANAHPDARNGHKTSEQIRTEFFEHFELGHDGRISRQDLEQYLFALSANEPDDARFNAILSDVWHLDLTYAVGGLVSKKTQKVRLQIALADGRRLVDDLDDTPDLRDAKGRLIEKEALRRLQFHKGLNAISVEEISKDQGNMENDTPVIIHTLANTLSQGDAQYKDRDNNNDDNGIPKTKDELVAAAGPRGNRSIPDVSQKLSEPSPPLDLAALGARLAEQLRDRGQLGFVALRRSFNARANNAGLLNLANFKTAIRSIGLEISESELRSLFSYVDSYGTATVERCLDVIRPRMSSRRAALVDIAFRILDVHDTGTIEPNVLATKFDAVAAPEVLAGRQTKEAVYDDFISAFVVDTNPRTGKAEISRQSFNDYHTDLSAAITDDAYFELFVRNVWHIEPQHLLRAGLTDSKKNDDDIVIVTRRTDGQQTIEHLPGTLRDQLDLNDERAVVTALKDHCGVIALSAVPVTNKAPDLQRGLAPNLAASNAANVQAAADLVARKFESRPRGKKIVGGVASIPTGGDSLPGKAAPARRYQHSLNSSRLQSEIDPGVAAIAGRLRNQLVSNRGIRGLVVLDRKLRAASIDASNGMSRHLTFDEVSRAARDCELDISGKELVALFAACDRDGEGTVDYTEWLGLIRPKLIGARAMSVISAWRRMFGQVQQVVPQDIAKRYNAAAHPEVTAGRATADTVHSEFLESFDIGDDVAGFATFREFENWHTALSATISNDDYFNLLVQSIWSSGLIEEDAKTESNTKSSKTVPLSALARRRRCEPTKFSQPAGAMLGVRDSIRDTFVNDTVPVSTSRQRKFSERKAKTGDFRDVVGIERLLMDLRRQLARHDARGIISLGRKFRNVDENNTKRLSMGKFRQVTKEFGMLELTDAEIRLIFAAMDKDSSGSIAYEEFLRAVRGTMNEQRRAVVNSAFDILDSDGSGVIDPAVIATKFDASQHPAVQNGERVADEIYREFLDQMDVGGEIDGRVTKQEFVQYYENVSSTIDDDSYFELMMRNIWHLSGSIETGNESKLRVVVTHADGSHSKCVVENDFELPRDSADIIDRLRAQGIIDVVGVSKATSDDDLSKEPRTFREVATSRAAGGGTRSSADIRRFSGKKMTGYNNHGGMFSSQIALGGYSDPPPPQKKKSISSTPAIVPATVCHLGFDMQEKDFVSEDLAPNQDNKASGSLGTALKRKDAQAILQMLRKRLIEMGVRGFAGLIRKFHTADTEASKKLSRSEFYQVLQQSSLRVNPSDMDILFSAFDRSGLIDYEEFLYELRGNMSPARLAIVDEAFCFLDTNCSKLIDIDDLVNKYDSSFHPSVLGGTKTSNEMFQEFLDTFECVGEVEGKVTKDEFIHYYENLSASIEDDAYFELILRNTWHLPRGNAQTANPSNTRVLVTHTNGTQSVECIEDDQGLDTSDSSHMIARLKRQGIDAVSVSLYGTATGAADTSKMMSNTYRTTFVLE
uniref:EF-hand domain-containing protein n=1 Tax=Aureoumbra lagunensis TaxID=44058 RepID=A0A7S3NJF0_9STRA